MNDNQKVEIYNKGFKAGQEHSEPSPDTKSFIAKMETELTNIKDQLEKIPTRDEMKLCIKEAIDSTLEQAGQKFASKSTEKIVWGIMGAVGFSFLGFLGYLIYTATIHLGA